MCRLNHLMQYSVKSYYEMEYSHDNILTLVELHIVYSVYTDAVVRWLGGGGQGGGRAH
jgi:hypothetical protein